MAVRLITSLQIPGRTTHSHIHLVIDSPGPRQQRPMQWTGGGIERARIDQQERTLARSDHGGFRKPDVVADGEPDLAIFREFDERQLVPRGEHLALFEGDLAGDVDVEEVCFAVGAD